MTVTVTDGTTPVSETIAITIGNTNRAPVLAPIGAKSGAEGSLLTFTVAATDADGDALTYSASGLPAGANFDAGTRTFSWTPGYDQAGPYSVTVTVTDGTTPVSETIAITIGNTNRAPVLAPIGAKSGAEGSLLTFTVAATDADGDTLTYSASGLPGGANFDAGTRTFSWTPGYDQAGPYSVTVTVTDGTTPVSETIAITIGNTNRAPVLAPIGAKSGAEGSLLTFTVAATDADGDALTYSASGLPAGANFDAGTRTFSWTPGYDQAGPYSVTVTVTDGTTPVSETIAITIGNTNRAPVLAPIGAKSGAEGSLLTFTVAATDADGDALTYSASGLPAGASFTAATRAFSWTPGYDQAGPYSVTVTVTDGTTPVSETIAITIGNTNRAPVLAPIGAKSGAEGSLLTFTVAATDADGDTLTYSASGLPGGANFDAGTRTFSWTPGYDQAGPYSVTVTVTDGTTPVSETIAITIGNTNRAPTAVNGTLPMVEDTPASGTLVATDADGDALAYAIVVNGTKGTAIITNVATGGFTYTPNANFNGTDTFTYTASDGTAVSNIATVDDHHRRRQRRAGGRRRQLRHGGRHAC